MHEVRNRVRGTSAGGGAGESPAASEAVAELMHLVEVDVPRDVHSHRPFMGAYVRLRRWVLREIRLTVDPILARQVALNRALVRVVAEQQSRIAELEERLGGPPRQ